MPTQPVKMFTAWSYSRWKDHSDPVTGCPRRAKYKHLDKLPEERGPALMRGGEIDEEATAYLTKPRTKLPKSLQNFTNEFAMLRKVKAVAQSKWAMTVDWKPTDFFNWTRAWCRVVLDAHFKPDPVTLRVIDFKTGRVYPDNERQVELYAVAAFAQDPTIERAEVELWYLDQGLILPDKPTDRGYTRAELPKLQKLWRQRVTPLLSDKKFLPRPGKHCERCTYSSRKNGPCQY